MIYRVIVELSPMSNNNERIYYKGESLEIGKTLPNGATIVISRPVYDVEITRGLKGHKEGGVSLFDEEAPDITSFFDSLYKMKHYCDTLKPIIPDFSVKTIIDHFVAQFYNCMSGGIPIYISSIIKEICDKTDIDRNMEIYPGEKGSSNGYYTLQDFLDEVNSPSLENIRDIVQKELPNISQFLLDSQH